MGKESEKLEAFPIMEQFDGVDYCLTSPPPWHMTILVGFQHYLVMLGTTVIIPTILVPYMGGGDYEKARVIQTVLFVAGINTLLQVYFGTRLPVVISGSYTYLYPAIAIATCGRYSYILDPYERFVITMRALQGALIIGAIWQLALGYFGVWRIFIRFLTPLAAVPIVTVSALGLFYLAFPGVAKCIEIGLPALIMFVIFAMYLPHAISKGSFIFDRCSLLVTVVIIWLFAEILTAAGAYNNSPPPTQFSCRTDRAGLIRATPWVRIPYPLQWGHPIFYFQDCFIMLAASFASLIESTGTCITASRFSGATFVPPSVFSRGVGWQGIALVLDGLFGTANGSAASVENVGLLAVTRVGSRRVIAVSACFMIFFAMFGKFGAILASIPMPIVAALYCVLYAYAASGGLCFLQFCNINKWRSKFIIGFSIFMGLSVPQYFREYELVSGFSPVHTHSFEFNVMVTVIFSSPATVAALIAYTMDSSHRYWDDDVRKERGWHHWERFKVYKEDTRNEEFYRLPYNLGKYFPSF